jgi:hypothetical protein
MPLRGCNDLGFSAQPMIQVFAVGTAFLLPDRVGSLRMACSLIDGPSPEEMAATTAGSVCRVDAVAIDLFLSLPSLMIAQPFPDSPGCPAAFECAATADKRLRAMVSVSRLRSPWGRREESDGCIVPMKPRTKPTTNRQRREWREGGRSKERRAATHAPDSEPGRRVTEAARLRVGGKSAAKLLTLDRV